MTNTYILAKIKEDEFEGEKLINKFRFIIALLYVSIVILFAILRKIENLEPFPAYGFIPNNIFLLFSVIIFFYLRKRKSVHDSFKYICVFFDMTIIAASIYVGCSYPELDPPIAYLSIWALFFFVLIMLGAFRYSFRCAVLSGFYAGLCYLITVILRANALDLDYFFELDGRLISVRFPVFNEFFRVIAMAVTGIITGMACKSHLRLFSGMIETQSQAVKTASRTVEQTHIMAETIKKSTDDIFLSSKNIFSIANNQAASIQEIESTINENTQIALEISEKTSSVASIASKMENDVNLGYSVLERNVSQLEEIKIKNDGVTSGMLELGEKILKIRDIIETINAITDQTKVIAFNAALEAASAGEHGRRFSVVSSEVNRLADDITSLTKEIRKQADDIKASSSSLIISGKDSSKKIREGNSLIKELENIFHDIHYGANETANQAQTITLSSQKQQKSIEHINTAICDISKGLFSFIHSTKAATTSAEKLTQIMNEMDNILSVHSNKKEEV
jgi:methyl-accepting chemotaxis protein